ncbi:hypothetical protein BH11BAC1_BH11BAC1_12440 [soil metagenome]
MQNKRTILIYFMLLLLLSSCGKQSDKNIITFSNDFEGQKGWGHIESLYEGMGHSGRFCTMTSATTPYGSIFRIKFKDIDNSRLNYFRFSAWCYSEGQVGEGRLVVSVDSDTSQSIIWHGWPLTDQMSGDGKWCEVSGELDLREKKANNPENTFVFYLWSNGKDPILGDDFHFEFSKN